MSQVLILKGIPASGKTTYAKQLVANDPNWKRVNKDDLRAMIDGGRWSKRNEHKILLIRNEILSQYLHDGYSVIIDDTNLHPKHENDIRCLISAWQQEGWCHNVEIVVKWFPITLEDAIARDKIRPNKVGATVIRRMMKQYEEAGGPTPEPLPKEELPPKPVFNPNVPHCIICDLDGTLSLFEEKGHRGPYDASNCDEDEINPVIEDIVKLYNNDEVHVILLSGRSAKYKEPTLRFLNKYKVPFTALHMRPEGDNRKDCVMKRELYDTYVKDKYNVLFVLDDRNQMVELWRSLGLTCLQVAPGNF